MLSFYIRGAERRTCETRLAMSGDGYELVITDRETSRVESFQVLEKLLAREQQLLMAWRAQGWRSADRAAAVR